MDRATVYLLSGCLALSAICFWNDLRIREMQKDIDFLVDREFKREFQK